VPPDLGNPLRPYLRSQTFANTPVRVVPTKYTPDAPAVTSLALIGYDDNSAATALSNPGWHVT
jgi:hypothetical protein